MAFAAAPVIAATVVRFGCLPTGRGRVTGRIAAGLGALAPPDSPVSAPPS